MITFSTEANNTRVNTHVNTHVPTFEELLVKMMPSFEFFAKNDLKLKGDNFDECVQDMTCMAYDIYTSLVNRGQTDKIFFTPIMNFAMKHFRCGRHYTGSSSTDVYGDCTKIKKRSELVPIHMMKENDDPTECLVDHRANVGRIVGFKIDFFETWLVQQTQQNQEIIHDLMMGETTGDVAKKFGFSAGRISQFRREYAESWYSFIYPAEETDFIEELREAAATYKPEPPLV